MNASFTLILVVVGAYLAAHVASSWLARRYNIVSGAEYLLLGILLGPHVSGLLSASVMGGFAPFLTLALGWIGVVVGAQFYLPDLIRIPAVRFRIAVSEAVLTLAGVTALLLLVLLWVPGMSVEQAVYPAVALGSIAVVASPAAVGLVARRLSTAGPVVRQLQLTTAVDAVVAIVTFGLLLSIDHAVPAGVVRPPTATEWAVIGVAIGVVGGVLFHLFLGDERKIDRLFIGLAGAVILASGAAAYLRLSPLLPALIIGAVLSNTSGSRPEILKVLSLVERPLYFVLLIFAGAAWRPSQSAWLVPVLAFLLVRPLVKLGAAALVAWLNGALPTLGAGWGRGLLGQGGLAIAIALNYQIHDRSLLSNVVFTAAVASVLLTDLTAPRGVEAVVRAARVRLLGPPAAPPARPVGTGRE